MQVIILQKKLQSFNLTQFGKESTPTCGKNNKKHSLLQKPLHLFTYSYILYVIHEALSVWKLRYWMKGKSISPPPTCLKNPRDNFQDNEKLLLYFSVLPSWLSDLHIIEKSNHPLYTFLLFVHHYWTSQRFP